VTLEAIHKEFAMRLTRQLMGLALLLFTDWAHSASASGAEICNRACLVEIAHQYLIALVKHDATGLPLAPEAKVTENAVRVPAASLGKSGVWLLAQGIRAQRQYVADPQNGQIGVLAIFDGTDNQLGVLALRLQVSQRRITEAEMLVSREGEAGPAWLPETFLYRESPYVREVPTTHRTTRGGLLKAVNTYWDLATTTHQGYAAPYADDCFRFENGATASWEAELSDEQLAQQKADLLGNGYKTNAVDGRIWGCARELVLTTRSWTAARARRFVVDEERGLVMSFALVDAVGPGLLGTLAAAGGPPDAGALRLEVLSAGTMVRPTQIGKMISGARTMGPGPPGMSIKGVQASQQARTIYQAQVNWIVDGRIKREQVFMHVLPANAAWPE
jgi:hypothetical protein